MGFAKYSIPYGIMLGYLENSSLYMLLVFFLKSQSSAESEVWADFVGQCRFG
jgi:hypothetical protein